jgi:hypothetical protein
MPDKNSRESGSFFIYGRLSFDLSIWDDNQWVCLIGIFRYI